MSARILIVEDDILNLLFISDCLQSRGYLVCEEVDGAKVVDVARDFCPDLITMDIKLPNLRGDEIIRQLKGDRDLAAVPVVAITAYTGTFDKERLRSVGAAAILAKPFTQKDLIETVERAIAGRDAA